MLQLFNIHWSKKNLIIRTKTNLYTTKQFDLLDNDGKKIRSWKMGVEWYYVIVKELKCSVVVALYIRMKNLLNKKSYWSRDPFLHCYVILQLFHKIFI